MNSKNQTSEPDARTGGRLVSGAAIRQRDSAIQKLEDAVQKRNAMIQKLDNTSQQRDALIQKLEDAIQRRDALIRKLKEESGSSAD